MFGSICTETWRIYSFYKGSSDAAQPLHLHAQAFWTNKAPNHFHRFAVPPLLSNCVNFVMEKKVCVSYLYFTFPIPDWIFFNEMMDLNTGFNNLFHDPWHFVAKI